MSYYFIAALLTALVGIGPLLVMRKFKPAMYIGGIAFFLTWFVYWLSVASTFYPFYGPAGVCVLLLWVICALVDGWDGQDLNASKLWALPIIGVVVYIGSALVGWNAFNWRIYSKMIGPVETRVWTEDVQPKDPRHMIMVEKKTADYLVRKALAQGGAIGSQFTIDTTHVRVQRVGGELVYVYPLDFAGISIWSSTNGVPAYMIAYAEDQERKPHLVRLPQDKLMHYTPEAFFNDNLERYVRAHGYLNTGLADLHLELDDSGNDLWVYTTYTLSVTWFGEKVTGIITVDPATGTITPYPLDKVPAWVDRVMPQKFVSSYLAWHGELSGSWFNTWWGGLNLTEPDRSNLIYGQGDKAEYVTGMTSKSGNDDSLLGLMYTDSRTGKTVFYQVDGGATDSAIVKAVNSNAQVKFRHLTATIPQIYNVYGTMAAVVPLVNDQNGFQGVAIAEVKNVQDVAVGTTQTAALRNYQTLIARRGQQVALEKKDAQRTLTGVVDRRMADCGPNGGQQLLHIAGVPRLFVGSGADFPTLPVTQAGDTVTVRYVASGESEVPIVAFDNVSLPLDKTEMQHEVEQAAQARADVEHGRDAARDIATKLQNMSPAQLEHFKELLSK